MACRYQAIFFTTASIVLGCVCGTQVSALHERPPEGDALAVSIPQSPAGSKLRWVLRVLNGAELGEVEEHFTERFLERINRQRIEKEFASIRAEVFKGKVIRVVQVDPGERGDTLSAVIAARGLDRALSVFLSVNDENGKIAGLRFESAAGSGDDAPAGGGDGGRGGDWKDFGGELDDLAGDISFGCYELVARDPRDPLTEWVVMPIAARDDERPLALGSTCKLYVLGALAEDVLAGRASWSENLAVREEWKSLPSGRMQLLPAGHEAPLSQYALNMISISDNTATDHLIHRLGRERVESFTNAINPHVALNTPFLTTREMFVIKLFEDINQRDVYARGADGAQRLMIGEGGVFHGVAPDLEAAGEWGEPRHIKTIEWFGGAKDVANVFARLRQLEQHEGMQALRDALRKNPGLALDAATWTSVAYKGGSEPGVLNMSWMLQRNDGRWYVFSVGQNDQTRLIDQERFIRLCYHGLEILSRDGREQDKADEPESDGQAPVRVTPVRDESPPRRLPPANDDDT